MDAGAFVGPWHGLAEGSPASVAENLPSLSYLLLRNRISLRTHFPRAKILTWKFVVIHLHRQNHSTHIVNYSIDI
jgi:hypothetical protein